MPLSPEIIQAIEAMAEQEYPFPLNCCRLTRMKIEWKREAFKQRMIEEYEKQIKQTA